MAACCALPAVVIGAGPPRGDAVSYSRDVLPVLQRSCLECHGPSKQSAGLRLDGDLRAVKVRGRLLTAPEGELLRRIALPATAPGRMPPRGAPLPAVEVETLRRWLRSGAPISKVDGSRTHWAYVPPVRPPAPPVRGADRAWVRTPVDAFVLERLYREGLRPSPEEEPGVLLRRISLDLIGLPPTPEELSAYLADDRSERYEAAVDRLLASAQFGERWARPWLDLARYADSHGFQRDDLREIWAYRDWVIRALNQDMPFDRFTLEQLAGDLLPGATADQIIATGFNRCVTTNVEAGSEPEETRVNQVFDRVNTLGAVWLGTTLECAQCHDHKYDPFSMRDYYRLFAYFNNTELEADRSDPKVPGSIRFLGPRMVLPATMAGDVTELLRRDLERLDAALAKARASDPEAKAAATRRLVRQREQLQAKIAAAAAPTTLVMKELAKPRETRIFTRGEYRHPGEAVSPGTPAHLAGRSFEPDRAGLARWLTDAANPLTARVVVNRWWDELFGQGIVRTAEDFGTRGERPTHPELLDWLAVELRENGWSMKKLLRVIVTSSTYRQSARVPPGLRRRDPESRLYARGPRRRMDAEMIRDSALAAAGLLSLKQGGPPVRPYQPPGLWTKIGGDPLEYVVSTGEDAYRRGVYTVWKRAAPYPSFANFDAGARLACVVRRPRTNTPLQALTLLNDPVYVEAAHALARRLIAHGSSDEEVSVRFGLRLLTCREPSAEEVAVLRRLYRSQKAAYETVPDAAEQLLRGHPRASGATGVEQAAWHAVATALLNLDEAICR